MSLEEKQTQPPPSKKIRVSTGDTETQNGAVDFSTFENFEVTRIINTSEKNCSVAVEGKLPGRDDLAVVHLQKLPFNEEKVKEIFSKCTKMRTLLHNDVYYNQMVSIPPELNEVRGMIIYPAEEKHLRKYESHPCSFVYETPEMYEKVTKPYSESSALGLQWIYNILEHKKEVDRIVCEDTDPSVGFILVPDLKWSGEQVEDLYLQALVMRRDISSIRDLRGAHIPLLENIYAKCTKAICDKYGVPANRLRVYFHYQPSFYHLHVHFSSLSFEAPGTWVGKAHALQDVISNLKIDSNYYQKATISFAITDGHPLMERFQQEEQKQNEAEK